jgi:hypothetical protein
MHGLPDDFDILKHDYIIVHNRMDVRMNMEKFETIVKTNYFLVNKTFFFTVC